MTKDKIHAVANEIHDNSKSFFLSHTISSCESYLRRDIDPVIEEERSLYKKFLKTIKQAVTNPADMPDEVAKRESRIEELKKSRPIIFLDIANKMNTVTARAIKFSSDKKIYSIVLPKLSDEPTKDDINNHRYRIAHELGHLVMHLDDIPHGGQGTIEVSKCNGKEREANMFADKIMQLKSDYYEELCCKKTFQIKKTKE